MRACLVSTKAIPGKTKIISFSNKITYWLVGLFPKHIIEYVGSEKKVIELNEAEQLINIFKRKKIKEDIIQKLRFVFEEIIKEDCFIHIADKKLEIEKKAYSKQQFIVATGIFDEYPLSIMPIGSNNMHSVEYKGGRKFKKLKNFEWHHMVVGDAIAFPWNSDNPSEQDKEKEIYYLHDSDFIKNIASNKVVLQKPPKPATSKNSCYVPDATVVFEEDDQDLDEDEYSFEEEKQFVPPAVIKQDFSSTKRSYSLPCLIETFGMSGYNGVAKVYDTKDKEIGLFSIKNGFVVGAEINQPRKEGVSALEHLVMLKNGSVSLNTKITPLERMKLRLPGELYDVIMTAERHLAGIKNDDNEFRKAEIR